jgi:hypothetical protein
MTQRTVRTEADRSAVIRLIQQREIPFTLSIAKGANRSIEQNKLLQKWMGEIAEQLGDRTAEQVRGDTKLRFGVPILRAEDEAFREKYDRLIKPRTYAEKLELMMEPFDFPVSRLMTTRQFTAFIDQTHQYYSERGVILTQPETAA